MKHLIAFVLAFASLSAHAEWVYLESTIDNNTSYFYKANSYKKTKFEASIIVKAEGKQDSLDFYIIKMLDSDCKNQFGQIHFHDTANKFLWSSPYVSNGGTVAQYIGDIICLMREEKKTGV